jgi:hypothetical protein
MLLGALTKEMHARHLLSPRPAIPFPGLSYAEIAKSIGTFRSPKWTCRGRPCDREHNRLYVDLDSIVYSVEGSMGGLTLEDLSPPEMKNDWAWIEGVKFGLSIIL